MKARIIPFLAAIAIIAGGLASQTAARSDDSYYLAPPVATNPSTSADPFDWHNVPMNERVNIVNATFDQGGYQLYDDVNEVILVPFTDQNLYVMKFARTYSSQMSFENVNGVPTLFIPRGGSLQNATLSSARWYPFSDDFQPTTPVYIGIAPSWNDYVAMGWYPGMAVYTGYWRYDAWSDGCTLTSPANYVVIINESRFVGWGPFHRSWIDRPAPYHMAIFHPEFYRRIGHPEILSSSWGRDRQPRRQSPFIGSNNAIQFGPANSNPFAPASPIDPFVSRNNSNAFDFRATMDNSQSKAYGWNHRTSPAPANGQSSAPTIRITAPANPVISNPVTREPRDNRDMRNNQDNRDRPDAHPFRGIDSLRSHNNQNGDPHQN